MEQTIGKPQCEMIITDTSEILHSTESSATGVPT